MSKTATKTVSSLYDEYMKRLSEQSESIDRVKDTIEDCTSRITAIQEEIDRNVHDLTPEEYSARIDEISKIQREKDLNVKKLSVISNRTHRGFDSEKDKTEFLTQLRTVYKAGEDAFDEECLVYLRALYKLLIDRKNEADKALTLASYLNDYTIRYCSDIRAVVAQTLATVNVKRGDILEN